MSLLFGIHYGITSDQHEVGACLVDNGRLKYCIEKERLLRVKTARVQTVNKRQNKKFYKLINEFYKITKVPVVLNTSFNLKGRPIVENPYDTIATFFSSGLDCLYLNSFLIEK